MLGVSIAEHYIFKIHSWAEMLSFISILCSVLNKLGITPWKMKQEGIVPFSHYMLYIMFVIQTFSIVHITR